MKLRTNISPPWGELEGTVFLFLIFILSSCSIEPSEINYGSDGCHFCKMTIVDRQHAAEIVTNKGKVYKYDAIECMLNDLKKGEKLDVGLYLINDYATPGKLIDATQATYIVSQSIPSPMGAFLTGFELQENADRVKEENDGEIFTWEELKKGVFSAQE